MLIIFKIMIVKDSFIKVIYGRELGIFKMELILL